MKNPVPRGGFRLKCFNSDGTMTGMMKSTIIAAAALCVFLALPVMLSAEEVRILTLQECISIGLQTHPSVSMAAEDQRMAVARFRQVEALKRLQIAGNARTYEVDDETPKSQSSPYLSLTPPSFLKSGTTTPKKLGLFTGLTSNYKLIHPDFSAKLDAARKGVEISRLSDLKQRSEVIFNIKRNFYRSLAARQIAELQKRLSENYRKRHETTVVLVRNGERPILDLSMSEVNYAQSNLDAKKAENNRIAMRNELYAAMGIFDPPANEIDLADITTLPELAFPVQKIIEIAENQSPAIKMAKFDREINRLKIEIARAADNTSVDVTLGLGMSNEKLYDYDNADKYSMKDWGGAVIFALNAAVPLYTGGAVSAGEDYAEAEYNRSVYSETSTVNEIKKQIRAIYRQMAELKDQSDISRLNAQNARTNLKLALISYENGTASQVVVQNAENQLLQSEIAMISSKYSYLENLALLSSLVGVDEENLCAK